MNIKDTIALQTGLSGERQTTGMRQKDGGLPWAEVGGRMQTPWRKGLHRDFEHALAETPLPERPDYEVAIRFLIKARHEMANHK